MDYRDDDIIDRGFCPICGQEVRDVMIDGSGLCTDHGRVWLNWTPLKNVPIDEEEDDV